MMLRHALFALAANVGFLAPAAASGLDAPEAGLSWRVGFGGATPSLQTGYTLSLGYRSHDADALTAQLLELDVSDRAAVAQLAGLPLFGRGHRLQAADDADPFPEDSSPWYARKWAWWTAGGLAATAALLNAASGGEEPTSSDITVSAGGARRVCVLSGGNVGDNEIPEACTPPVDETGTGWTDRADRRGDPRVVESAAHLDAGTGHMGDLIAR